MNPKKIQNKTFSEIEIGDTANTEHTLTQRDIQIFAIMSGDINPAHLDDEYANSSMFKGIIAHGMWSGSIISTVLGTQLPGPGTIYLSQTLKFMNPVREGDSINAMVKTIAKDEKTKRITFECLCTNQEGKTVVKGEAVVIAPQEKIVRKAIDLPSIELKEKIATVYEQLIAKQINMEPIKVAVVNPTDFNSLKGAVYAAEEKIIEPVLIGIEQRIQDVADKGNINITPYKIINTQHSHAAAEYAVSLAHKGEVDALMKGKIQTSELLKEAMNKSSGLRTEKTMSHVFMLQAPSYKKPLFLTDAAINIKPNLMAKKDIVQNAINLFTALGYGKPKVAILSAVEKVVEDIPSTLDATALCKMSDRGQITGGILDGPLAMDNAISKQAAEAKAIVSAVAGDADILVAPDLESANILYKQMRFLSNMDGAGIVLGAKVPIILTSRAAGAIGTRTASCALAALYVRNHKKNLIKQAGKLN